MQQLKGSVALVAGATRGAGRGIARMLGEAGATVYCTGRSVRGNPATGNRPETIDETAEMVTLHGGVGIPVRVDHTVPAQVDALVERIKRDHARLNLLVNDVWGGDELTEWGKHFWEHSLANGLLMQERAVYSHIITSYYAAPLLMRSQGSLIVEITDGDGPEYRGNLFYDMAKSSVIRLAYGMAEELRPHGVSALALTPGFLRSEAMLDYFGVTERNWRDAIQKDANFEFSETPFFIGRAVVALASDPEVSKRSGSVVSTWALAKEFDFTDIDGTRPDWGSHYSEVLGRQGQ